jgi:hypothetical protein
VKKNKENSLGIMIAFVVLTALLLTSAPMALAQEESPEAEPGGPLLSATQEQKSINLADAVAKAAEEAAEAAADAQAAYDAALEAYENPPDDATDEELAALEAAKDKAREELEAANDAAAEAAARAADTTPETVALMREDGMGWGEIAHELGVHPSVLGLGNQFANGFTNREAKMANLRNKKGGVPPGHGLTADGELLSNKGIGASKSNNAGGKAKGKDKGKGKAKGKGKSKGKSKNK